MLNLGHLYRSQGQRLASTMSLDGMKEEVTDRSQEANLSETGALEELDRAGMGTCVVELRNKVGTRPVEELMRQNKYREGRRGKTDRNYCQPRSRAQQGW